MIAKTEVVAGLRRWAQGWPADAAAVELLIRSYSGQYVRASWPWVHPCRRPGWYWLDGYALAVHAAKVTGERRRVLSIAAELLGAETTSSPAAGQVPTHVDADRRAA